MSDPAVDRKSMELEGSLRSFKLADILKFLAMGRITGHLTLSSSDSRTVRLTIREGCLTGSSSPERFMKLGQLLVYSGDITRKDLEEILLSQTECAGRQQLGILLIERGLATEEQITGALHLQIKEELWELFSWDDGTFKFEHGVEAECAGMELSISIDELIEEGSLRREKWDTIARNLNDMTVIFKVRSDVASPPDTRLRPNAWRVLSLINGRNSIQLLVLLSRLGKFETLCALDDLLGLQLIEPVDENILSQASLKAETAKEDDQLGMVESENKPEADGSPDPGKSGGLRGLFGLGRRNEQAQESEADPEVQARQKEVGPFRTSAGWACALISSLLELCCAETGDDAFESACLAWYQIGLRFPRADLVEVNQGRFSPDRFEKYVEHAGGITKDLSGSHDDIMEALEAIGQHLVKKIRSTNPRKAGEIIENIAQPYLAQVQIDGPAEFSPSHWFEGLKGTRTCDG